ncbi:MAG: formylmethanofuran dehydrogenase [Candidatus Methanoperedens sp.]|nr:formylmethanofuran dehydrogenase [Candidatus Methanoperedens sp.]
MLLTIKERVDSLCDYTYDFTWQSNKLRPGDIIPFQQGTSYNFKDLVDELRKGKDVRIIGNTGKRLAYSLGVDLKHFGGTGSVEKAGNIYIDGDAGVEMGMGMVSGVIYVRGRVTEFICKGKDKLVNNKYDERSHHLLIDDGLLRGTIAARCDCEALVTVEGDTCNGTGLLMQKGVVHVKGDAGMNTGAHLDGGVVIVEGRAGEFAGAYMKKGALILGDTSGFAGANMKDGVIFAKKKIKTSPPVEELSMSQEDARVIMKHLGKGHVEAMSYHKYGIMRERLVRMRDGSVVVRRVE